MSTQLAVNRRTATKAAIRRGSAVARRKMNALDAVALAQLEQIYEQAAAEIEDEIHAYADRDGTLRLEVLRSLLSQVNQRIGALSKARNALLDEQLLSASALGVSPYGEEAASVAHRAVQFVRSFTAEDGLQLSDRLWRLDQGAREAVGQAIQVAMVQGHDASRAAQEFLRKKAPIPADIMAKIKAAGADDLAAAAGRALLHDEGNAYAAARRVFRTEMNRAHGEAYMAGGENVDGFAGWRFLLSPGHPRQDICDMHARANLHGLGPGVYPSRERCPWPAHPNTLSYTEIVFEDEISAADRKGKTDRISWLKSQSPKTQEAVLGSANKRAALEQGILRENEIATPWRVLQKRYEGRGFLPRSIPANPVTAKPRRSVPFRPSGVPVSNAVKPMQYKRIADQLLAVVDRVHGDGRLPLIPMLRTASRKNLGGYVRTLDGRAVRIELSQYGDHKELTLAHEVGHFLDHQGVAAGSFASHSHDAFTAWREAVASSEGIKNLERLLSGPTYINIDGKQHEINKGYIEYLLRTREIWARSYAQYVAIRGGNDILKEQLSSMQSNQAGKLYAMQWSDEDFAPVADAIDEAFLKLGWISD